MRIGVDFDNTIVKYDEIFHRAALERGLIPPDTPVSKEAVRDRMRRDGRENDWTELQGHVYGEGILSAPPLPGVRDFFRQCRMLGLETHIVSHKTLIPVLGPPHDLHAAAIRWLHQEGFLHRETGLDASRIHFELTKAAKLARIDALDCDYFIDDLPEFLMEPDFPRDVVRILFDPSREDSPDPDLLHLRSWPEIVRRVSGIAPCASFLDEAGFPGAILEPLTGGANNRVYRVVCPDRVALLKSYFQHSRDGRSRLESEYAFARFAREHGLEEAAFPLARDAGRNLALFEFFEGRRATAEDITDTAVRRALDFYRAINRAASAGDASRLSTAAEACFSLQEHLQCVERRIARLAEVPAASTADAGMADLLANDLMPIWKRVEDEARTAAETCGIETTARLPRSEWRLSPSDFGFHNMLVADNGRIRFIDFEYAGWDDPAKMACDFFCQPALPVPMKFFAPFRDAVAAEERQPETVRARIDILLPVYRVKWCCILLNEFLDVGAARRRFAADSRPLEEQKQNQLSKVWAMVEQWFSKEHAA